MYSTTGFSRESIVDLCAMIHAEAMDDRQPWPPILGLFKSVTVALTYMRRPGPGVEVPVPVAVTDIHPLR
jgi:hypothetical protein